MALCIVGIIDLSKQVFTANSYLYRYNTSMHMYVYHFEYYFRVEITIVVLYDITISCEWRFVLTFEISSINNYSQNQGEYLRKKKKKKGRIYWSFSLRVPIG